LDGSTEKGRFDASFQIHVIYLLFQS